MWVSVVSMQLVHSLGVSCHLAVTATLAYSSAYIDALGRHDSMRFAAALGRVLCRVQDVCVGGWQCLWPWLQRPVAYIRHSARMLVYYCDVLNGRWDLCP